MIAILAISSINIINKLEEIMNEKIIPSRRRNRCPLIRNIFSTELALLLPVPIEHYLGSPHDISCGIVEQLPEFHPAGDIDQQVSLMRKALQYQKQSRPSETYLPKNTKDKNSEDQENPERPIQTEKPPANMLEAPRSKKDSLTNDVQFMREIEKLMKGNRMNSRCKSHEYPGK